VTGGSTAGRAVSVAGVGAYLPEKVVGLDFFFDGPPPDDPMLHSPLVGPPPLRHHVAPDQRASDMIHRAATPLLKRLGIAATDIDILLTNVLVPDELFTGCGAETAALLGCAPEWMLDLHNTGCASFAYMMRLAGVLISTGQARTALLANVQNAGGQVFSQSQVRLLPQARTPGDGCGVAVLTADDRSPLLGTAVRNTPSAAADLRVGAEGRKYWEPGTGQVDVRFDPNRTQQTLDLGNRVVPEVVRELCEDIDVKVADIDVFITNQPNRTFLRNWRDALGIPPERHVDTYDTLGNLYGAGLPVTLDHALRGGRVRPGDLVVVAGFAHAGDFAAAAAFRWQAKA
jgi:3-oxoacyl-[acyl-carrier-protein] synthase-3